MLTIHARQLERLAADILTAAGANEKESQVVSRHLVAANLAGHDSHGAMRVLQYVEDVDAGRIVPGTELRIINDWANGSVLDARGVFGQVACDEAMRRAIDKAHAASLAAVTIRHSNHSGRLGTYVEVAAEEGMIGIAMANGGGGGRWVAPFGGRERRLSTNPIAIGAPSGKSFPFVLDMSTSVAPEGKVRDYLQREESTPDGWLVDHRGEPTGDPGELYRDPGGALLPFGGQAGHKGFGLAFMVDMFAGALSAAGCPSFQDADPANGTGLFMLAIDIQRFDALDAFTRRMKQMADYLKSARPAAGFAEVIVPGEFEARQRQQRERDGIRIPVTVWKTLVSLADRLGLSYNPGELTHE